MAADLYPDAPKASFTNLKHYNHGLQNRRWNGMGE